MNPPAPWPCAAVDGPLPWARGARAALGVAVALALVACASGPGRGGKDGPEARPPPNLAKVPDAEPRVDPVRPGGPNKPYEVLGRDYTPLRGDPVVVERGIASWYGKKFHGRRTASGETYNMYAMTAAHKTMPIPSYARVRNPKNGREVIVRVNDRGPFHAGRVIDLSYTAALRLGVHHGVAPVEVERITHEQIRSGSWRRGTEPAEAEAAPTAVAEPQAAPEEPSAVVAAAAEPAPVDVPVPLPPSVTPPTVRNDQPTTHAWTTAGQGFWIQLGAFRQRGGAEQFHRHVSGELEWLSPLLAVFSEPSIYRLQAGPYPDRGEAQAAAERIRASLQLVPVIMEKRR